MGADPPYREQASQGFTSVRNVGVPVDQPLVAASNTPKRVLLLADSGNGAPLFQELSALGYDIYWARDSIEARWLWLPDFYERVLISLLDEEGADGLLAR